LSGATYFNGSLVSEKIFAIKKFLQLTGGAKFNKTYKYLVGKLSLKKMLSEVRFRFCTSEDNLIGITSLLC